MFIADDSTLIRRRIKALLDKQGNIQVVGEAGGTAEALRCLQTLSVDVVIVDIRMPGGGLKLVKALQQWPEKPHILVYTSQNSPIYRDTFLRAGADGFFDKAHETERLVTRIVSFGDVNDQRGH